MKDHTYVPGVNPGCNYWENGQRCSVEGRVHRQPITDEPENRPELPAAVQEIVEAVGGKIDWAVQLPDGSGAATMSMPLPKDHWLTRPGHNVPPMVFRCGVDRMFFWDVGEPVPSPMDPQTRTVVGTLTAWNRQELAEAIRAAGKYAVRCATMNGAEEDFDPDALLQNLVVGFLGYWTKDGRSTEDWENPPSPWQPPESAKLG